MRARHVRQVRAHAPELAEFDSRERERARLSPNAIKAQLAVLEAWFDSGAARGFDHPETEALVEESDRLLDLIDQGKDIPPDEAIAVMGRFGRRGDTVV